MSLGLSFCLYISVFGSCLCLSVCLCLCLCLSVCLSLSLCLSLCLCMFVSVSLSVSVTVAVCLSVSLSVSLCLCLCLSVAVCCLSLSLFLCLSLSLSPPLPPAFLPLLECIPGLVFFFGFTAEYCISRAVVTEKIALQQQRQLMFLKQNKSNLISRESWQSLHAAIHSSVTLVKFLPTQQAWALSVYPSVCLCLSVGRSLPACLSVCLSVSGLYKKTLCLLHCPRNMNDDC